MPVRYQDIRLNREYGIRGINSYQDYPPMIVRVITQPPVYSPAGDFYPSFNVLILRRLAEVPVLAAYRESIDSNTQPGKVLTINWRNRFWGHPWSDYGLSWKFVNTVLQPLPSDIANKKLALQELKSIPSNEVFPGGTDFLSMVAAKQSFQGGVSYFKPNYSLF